MIPCRLLKPFDNYVYINITVLHILSVLSICPKTLGESQWMASSRLCCKWKRDFWSYYWSITCDESVISAHRADWYNKCGRALLSSYVRVGCFPDSIHYLFSLVVLSLSATPSKLAIRTTIAVFPVCYNWAVRWNIKEVRAAKCNVSPFGCTVMMQMALPLHSCYAMGYSHLRCSHCFAF